MEERHGKIARFAPVEETGPAGVVAHCRDAFDGRAFAGLAEAEQDALIERMEEGELDLGDVPLATFFALVHDNTIEGFFSDPIYGGNRDMAGWRLVGFPDVRYDYRDYLDHDGAPNRARSGRPDGPPGLERRLNCALAHWSEDDIVAFLKTGRNAHTAAFGTMSEVIELSTQHMLESDLRAMAVYLKSLDGEARPAPAEPDAAGMNAGAAIYFDNCSACHVSDGSGVAGFFAPLAGAAKANDPDATTVVRVILEGARAVPTKAHPTPLTMPAYAWTLTDAQIAAVATYVRMSWGNRGGAVTASEVARLRQRLAADLGPD